MLNLIFSKIVNIKKFFFKTPHDRYIRKLHQERLVFYQQFIKKGDLCFDIGANIGDRTKTFLELGAIVISVEPQKSCCEILKKRFGNKITLIQKGVGSKNEVKDFFISNHNQLSTFSEEWIDTLKTNRFKESEWNEVEKIEIVTLDSIIQQYGAPSFIKIDVEGFELEVLKGLTESFKFLSFEFAVPDNLNNLLLCLYQLNINNNNLLFNYAVLDNTFLALDKWVTVDEMKSIVQSSEFMENSAGDIYVKCFR
jgi:FkbM family methyltransferase